MPDGPNLAELTTGEREKCGARVDGGVYEAFRDWVHEQTGKQYYEVGRALDRAMLEYMTDDINQETLAQTKKNEALLKQVLTRLDGEKEKEKGTTDNGDVPKGKDPGSRREREAHVVRSLLANDADVVGLESLKQVIEEVAGVSSDRTVRGYVESITATAAMQPHQRAGTWRFDPDGAREVLRQRGVSIPERDVA